MSSYLTSFFVVVIFLSPPKTITATIPPPPPFLMSPCAVSPDEGREHVSYSLFLSFICGVGQIMTRSLLLYCHLKILLSRVSADVAGTIFPLARTPFSST